jgi:hypothetical protein
VYIKLKMDGTKMKIISGEDRLSKKQGEAGMN